MTTIENFTHGFWHPFGVHGGELREAIIRRKRDEIAANGWTLWSFQRRKSLDAWRSLLPASSPVFVLCSDSPNARDPKTEPRPARFFRSGLHEALQPIPSAVWVPHPANNKAGLGSAFVVEEVITFSREEAEQLKFEVHWFASRASQWRTDKLPTRGEYLIRARGAVPTRRVFAMLRLRAPFVVEISA